MKRITPEMMAEALGIPTQTVRIGLQREAFDFGKAFKQTGKNNYTYVIFPGIAKKYVSQEYAMKWGI